jgi:hypothetical protein
MAHAYNKNPRKHLQACGGFLLLSTDRVGRFAKEINPAFAGTLFFGEAHFKLLDPLLATPADATEPSST